MKNLGEASIIVELKDGWIIVRHGQDKHIILFRKKAREGTWEKIWLAITKTK